MVLMLLAGCAAQAQVGSVTGVTGVTEPAPPQVAKPSEPAVLLREPNAAVVKGTRVGFEGPPEARSWPALAQWHVPAGTSRP